MNPIASLLNLHLSVEKFLFDNLVTVTEVVPATDPITYTYDILLVNKDDVLSRFTEISDAGKAILWHIPTTVAGNKCDLTLYIGYTAFKDIGNLGLLAQLDLIKGLIDSTGSITMYDYTVSPNTEITQIAVMHPITVLPLVSEPNMFKTRFITVKLKYGQILA